MKILGVHVGHDSGAALIVDGRLVADVAEERFARIKHFAGIPVRSVDYCLKAGGCTIGDIDIVAIPTRYSLPPLNHLFELRDGRREAGTRKNQLLQFARRMTGSNIQKPPLYWQRFPLGPKTEVVHVEHHLAHAASAYYPSGIRDRTLIVTCDGAGDGFSFCVWRGEHGRIAPLEKMPVSASIGWFYSNVTEALGWIHGDGEGKTMGLAPYGDFARCRGVLDKYYPKFQGGAVVESHDFGQVYYWNDEGYFEFHFDEADEIKKLVDRYGAADVAAEAQRVLEEQVLAVILPWLEKEQTRNLCCAGGVFLNVKLNQRVWYSGAVDRHFVYPNAGDSGLAHGAALYCLHNTAGATQTESIEHLYWGPSFDDNGMEQLLRDRRVPYTRHDDIEAKVARLLADNQIVAWFQGRMESGPRALGNRSILMSTARPENKDVINARVKFREGFRPFCPSMLDERRGDYLVNPRSERFMITSFDTVASKKCRIPAVVHADGTARPQTVEQRINPRFWRLLREFESITGEGVLLNTSLNIKGEPMICSPREAIRCFFDSGLDALALGDLLLQKTAPA